MARPEYQALSYRLVRWLSRLLLSAFYRRWSLFHPERVPAGPLVVCPNHHGSLVDPMVLIAGFERPLRPLAKAPLFRSRLLRQFLDAVGALPVFRPQDRHLVTGSNQDLLAASGCATGPARRSNWQSPLHQDHPLVGQVWDVRWQQFVSMDALEAKARDAHLLLLGETHDNPDHHLLQADLVRAAASSGRRQPAAHDATVPARPVAAAEPTS